LLVFVSLLIVLLLWTAFMAGKKHCFLFHQLNTDNRRHLGLRQSAYLPALVAIAVIPHPQHYSLAV
jgi:hypothetical protein